MTLATMQPTGLPRWRSHCCGEKKYPSGSSLSVLTCRLCMPQSRSSTKAHCCMANCACPPTWRAALLRSEEHTSELQSRLHLVCRLLLEKKKTDITAHPYHAGADTQQSRSSLYI